MPALHLGKSIIAFFLLFTLSLPATAGAIDCLGALSALPAGGVLNPLLKRRVLTILKVAERRNFEALPFTQELTAKLQSKQNENFWLVDPFLQGVITRATDTSRIKINMLTSSRYGVQFVHPAIQQITQSVPGLQRLGQIFSGYTGIYEGFFRRLPGIDASVVVGFYGILKMISFEINANPALQTVIIDAGIVTNHDLRKFVRDAGFSEKPSEGPGRRPPQFELKIEREQNQELWDALAKIWD